jgi:hypothetical protein
VVESTTKAGELVSNICRDLKFHAGSATGLSLFLETGKKRKMNICWKFFYEFLFMF